MSEDKKPKIDLKARLGKKTVGSPAGASIPPPAGIPQPSGVGAPAPSPSGIPAPPFAGSSRPAAAPSPYGASSPYGSVAPNPYGAPAPAAAPFSANPYAEPAPVARAEPAAIRIEMGDEVIAAQKSGRTKVMVLAAVTAVIGGIVGYTIGGGAERGKAADAAIFGAQELVKDVTAANTKIEELAETLKSAREKLSKAQFPEEEVTKLGAINIPFEGSNLTGKGIGRFKADVVSALIDFASAAEEANDQKEKIQNVLSGSKKGIQDFLGDQTNPQVRWSVIVSGSPNGPIASMQPVPKPFLAKEKWLDEFQVQAGGKPATIKRYTTGNPVSEDGLFIPVDPSTQGSVCPSDVLVRLRRELNDMERVLRGDNSVPGEEHPGLLEAGKKLVDQLKKIGKDPAEAK